MPDHLHFLAEGAHEDCDLLEFVRVFKQRTGYEFRKNSASHLWEKSFYDYILRPNDVAETIAAYIWMNPVRKNPCTQPSDYAFSGSQTIDWIMQPSRAPLWFPPWKRKEPA